MVISSQGERAVFLNFLDIAIILVALAFLIKGLVRGFIREVAALAGLALGLILALRYSKEAEGLLAQALGPWTFLDLVAFALIFVGVFVVVTIIGTLLSRLTAKVWLGGLNRFLGLILGAAQGAVLIILGVCLLAYLGGPESPALTGSRLAPPVLKTVAWGLGQMPESLSKSLAEKRRLIEEKFKPAPESK